MEELKYHYKYPHPAVTTDCVVFGYDGRQLKVLLIERGNEPDKGKWAFPGGFLNIDEPADEGARRELEEETGYQADQWYYLGRIHNAIGYSDEHLEFFLAKGLKAGDRHLDEGECLEVYRLPFKEVKEMTLNGDITDVKTIIGVFWLEKYLKGEMAAQAC